MGNGTNADSNIPVTVVDADGVTPLAGVTAISAGGAHTCAVVALGQLRCWGGDASGQLGNPTAGFSSSLPVTVVDADGVTPLIGAAALAVGGDVASGAGHSCAVVALGQVKCWGDNSDGQLGYEIQNGSTVMSSTVPLIAVDADGVTPLSGATAIAAGSRHSCAVLALGTVKCWGTTFGGDLGNAPGTMAHSPGSTVIDVDGVTPLSGATAITSERSQTCVVVASGTVKCWGVGYTPVENLVVVAGVTGATTISAGYDFGSMQCSVVTGGAVSCVQSGGPVFDLSGLTGVTAIDSGVGYACAVVPGGGVRCWGANNQSGQQGDGTNAAPATLPVTVLGIP